MDIIHIIAKELKLKIGQVNQVVNLLDSGNTIPFIARYRKEATGELDETVLRELNDRLEYLRNIEKRKAEVIHIIEEQGKLSEELKTKIEQAVKLQEVEDLYRPYKQKRRTRASIAREKGLEQLAMWIWSQPESGNILEEAKKYVDAEKGVASDQEAIAGAEDIIAEDISDDAEVRKIIRELTFREGDIVAKAKKADRSPYEMYYDYRELVRKIPAHRVLALNRGEKEEFLSVKIEVETDKIIAFLERRYLKSGMCAEIIQKVIQDSYKRLIAPSIERDIRSSITLLAEEQAIKVFAANLRQLLLQPPVRGKIMMGLDPGFRTGCKWAVVDATGKLGDVGVIYPHPPQKKREEAKEIIYSVAMKHNVEIIAIGNGTASRETEEIVAELIKEKELKQQYIIVSEAGASVYSASKLAKEEFPEYDLSLRSAVSIARRLQDPLAELVKIEPKAVGVGQYQHDVQPKALESSLTGVVESCVNTVGVDINTASAAIFRYISGLNNTVAKNIVQYRDKNGIFKSRNELKKVSRLGEQSFIQCAGFIRVPDGENPLENTSVHPESYELAERILKKVGFELIDLRDKSRIISKELSFIDPEKIAEEFEAGVPTVKDIIEALQKPGRDPREDLPKPILRTDVVKIEDLKEGMILEGTVRNVVDFGVFVDIGIKHDGLVHISQICDKFIKHPMEVVSVGDIVKVKVMSIEAERQRIALSMREV
ncbi:MAG: Tex family protein [Eubacteriales bacterium]